MSDQKPTAAAQPKREKKEPYSEMQRVMDSILLHAEHQWDRFQMYFSRRNRPSHAER